MLLGLSTIPQRSTPALPAGMIVQGDFSLLGSGQREASPVLC